MGTTDGGRITLATCNSIRCAGSGDQGIAIGPDRFCIGNTCAAWREAYEERHDATGFCGLAGPIKTKGS